MSLEVEIKFSIDSLKNVEALINLLGGRLVSMEDQVDVYFQHPCRDLALSDEALRVRKSDSSISITYKGPRFGGWFKARCEEELKVSSFESAVNILQALGFREVAVIKKHRALYELEEFKIHLDEVENLGFFIEVEVKDRGAMAEERLKNLADRLKLPLDRATSKSYLELFLEKEASQS